MKILINYKNIENTTIKFGIFNFFIFGEFMIFIIKNNKYYEWKSR